MPSQARAIIIHYHSVASYAILSPIAWHASCILGIDNALSFAVEPALEKMPCVMRTAGSLSTGASCP